MSPTWFCICIPSTLTVFCFPVHLSPVCLLPSVCVPSYLKELLFLCYVEVGQLGLGVQIIQYIECPFSLALSFQ